MSRVYEFISRWRWEKRLEVSVRVGRPSRMLGAKYAKKAKFIDRHFRASHAKKKPLLAANCLFRFFL